MAAAHVHQHITSHFFHDFALKNNKLYNTTLSLKHLDAALFECFSGKMACMWTSVCNQSNDVIFLENSSTVDLYRCTFAYVHLHDYTG